MDSATLERVESARVRFLLWKTVILFCVGAGIVVGEFPVGETVRTVAAVVAGVAFAALLVVSRRETKCFRAVERDKELEEALDNEMYKAYSYKAVALGYYVMVALAFVVCFFLRRVDLPWRAVLLGIAFAGILSTNVRLLLYYKQS